MNGRWVVAVLGVVATVAVLASLGPARDRMRARFPSSARIDGRVGLSPLDREIRDSLERAKSYGAGPVVVGQIVVANGGASPRDVTAQMPIFPDGQFAGEIGDRHQPVRFLLHGYEPYDLKLPPTATGDVVRVGQVVLQPLAEFSRAGLRGRVALADGQDPAQVTVQLSIDLAWEEINHPAHGVAPGSGGAPPVVVPVQSDGRFEATGCSPAEYLLDVHGPGLTYSEHVRLQPGQTTDVGTIQRDRLSRVAITYLAAADPLGFAAAPVQTASAGVGGLWKAGGPHWQAVAQQYGADYGFTIDFLPRAGSVCMHVFYQPAAMADLGPGQLDAFRHIDPSSVALQPPTDEEPQDGHVYLLHHEVFNYWTLFEVHLLPPSTPAL